MVRAVSGSLAAFGVSGAASGLALSVCGNGSLLATAPDWTTTPARIALYQGLFQIAGAFPLAPGNGDVALLIELSPGAYTAQVTASTGGAVLLEVYFMP